MQSPLSRALSRALLCLKLCLAPLCGSAQQTLPATLEVALAQAHIPPEALALRVEEAATRGTPALRLTHQSQLPMNPASVMKLTTTIAALDLLGPAYTWSTPVYLEGTLQNGTLHGNVYIQGQGDPKLVLEQLWLLLRRLRGSGVERISGDIVLDHSAFALPDTDPASFDEAPLRPYNAAPDALLINFKSVLLTLHADRIGHRARVQVDPPLYGVQMPASVPLLDGDCGDYRARLKANFSDPKVILLAGAYPASCGEKVWPVAYADPHSYALRAVQGLWRDMGQGLSGSVRYGQVPAAVLQQGPAFALASAPLAELVRDINKYSNNVMAQQVFLTLGRLSTPGTGTGMLPEPSGFAQARALMQTWWHQHFGDAQTPLFENGSGLSRQERISAQGLADLLQAAYRAPYMSELMSSLPVNGVDGTLKRFTAHASAHLKTGTLDGVIARAGYVDGDSGKRYVLVAIINHPNANSEAARQWMETLVDWVAHDQ